METRASEGLRDALGAHGRRGRAELVDEELHVLMEAEGERTPSRAFSFPSSPVPPSGLCLAVACDGAHVSAKADTEFRRQARQR